jgi:hypothetical protein
MQMDQFSHSTVYKRMLQTAAEVWNIKESDLSALDPTFRLLLNAISKEVEKVGHELKTAEARILKRLARQLLPYEAQSVMPAHSVIHFNPTERVELSGYEEFQFEKRWNNKEKFNRLETKTVSFSPAANLKMYPHKIAFRIEKEKVYAIEGMGQELLDLGSPLKDDKRIIIGIENYKGDKLSLYFDWFAETEKRDLFSFLDKTRFSTINGQALKMTKGLCANDVRNSPFMDRINMMKQMENLVVSYYNDRFMEIEMSEQAAESEKNEFPQGLRDLCLALDPDGDCTWIALDFPDEISERFINELFIQANCFPVVNRKFERQVIRLQPELNIKKLDFEGAFLSIERVESSAGNPYQEVKTIASEINRPGTFSLRRGNVGRLDEREAAEFLVYIIDLIKEEKQAFASTEASSTSEDLKTIEQALRRVENRVSSAGLSNTRPYVMITPFKDYENAYIYFWSTDASFANGIAKESEVISKIPGISLDGKALVLSDVAGGEDELSDALLIAKYRNALLTKDAIVTKADLVSHCQTLGDGYIRSVEVRKEVVPSNLGRQGLMQVLNIYVAFSDNIGDVSKKDYLLQRLESQILAKSNFSIPIKVLESHA